MAPVDLEASETCQVLREASCQSQRKGHGFGFGRRMRGRDYAAAQDDIRGCIGPRGTRTRARRWTRPWTQTHSPRQRWQYNDLPYRRLRKSMSLSGPRKENEEDHALAQHLLLLVTSPKASRLKAGWLGGARAAMKLQTALSLELASSSDDHANMASVSEEPLCSDSLATADPWARGPRREQERQSSTRPLLCHASHWTPVNSQMLPSAGFSAQVGPAAQPPA